MARFCVVVTLAVCCLITGSETWLSYDCYDNSQCPAERKSTCYSFKCVCTPGYYYSSSQGMCIKECPNIKPWNGLVRYLYTSVNVSSISKAVYRDNQRCLLSCRLEPKCRVVVYNFRSGECSIPDVTAVGLSSDRWFQADNTITYVKECA